MSRAGTCLLLVAALPLSSTAEAGDSPSFRRDVMAAVSKAGCNLGTCHGNANGKGGFKLSLRGEDPAGDYRILTRDVTGRRVNVQAPAESLLLRKPTMQAAHEGGQRFTLESPEYKIFHDWIAAGARDDGDAARLDVGRDDRLDLHGRGRRKLDQAEHLAGVQQDGDRLGDRPGVLVAALSFGDDEGGTGEVRRGLPAGRRIDVGLQHGGGA